MAIECDNYGFFNGIYGLEQSNWANYWRGIIPDGVVAGMGDELEVYRSNNPTYNFSVNIRSGQAMVDNHRCWVNQDVEMQLPAKPSANKRYDLIVLRATYGNTEESKIELACLTGQPEANPAIPSLTKVTGNIYEVPLAKILRTSDETTIAASRITDMRYIFHMPGDENLVRAFSGNSVTVDNDREYRNNTAQTSLTIFVPKDPIPTFICGVNFSTGSSFSGVTFKYKGSSESINNSIKIVGDTLEMLNRRYNLIIWWDGKNYMVASKSAE